MRDTSADGGTASPSAADSRSRGRVRGWARGLSALVVAGVAAYSSYGHQRVFAVEAGADAVTAAIWPLSVDGLAILSSIGLLDRHPGRARRLRWALRLSFLLSVVVSLAANVAAAPVLSWQAVLVAGWPPLALLLAVDLVMHGHARGDTAEDTGGATRSADAVSAASSATGGTRSAVGGTDGRDDQRSARSFATPSKPVPSRTDGTRTTRRAGQIASQLTFIPPDVDATAQPETKSGTPAARPRRRPGTRPAVGVAEEVMWAHCERELAQGRVPSGAELDRVAGTRSYGRAVLARWRQAGRIPSPRELAARVVASGDAAADGGGAPGEQLGVDASAGGRAGARPVTVGGRSE